MAAPDNAVIVRGEVMPHWRARDVPSSVRSLLEKGTPVGRAARCDIRARESVLWWIVTKGSQRWLGIGSQGLLSAGRPHLRECCSQAQAPTPHPRNPLASLVPGTDWFCRRLARWLPLRASRKTGTPARAVC